jgi:hypothetical protein
MKNIAPVAKTFGINLETLTASLGILADNQIKGSEAGNNLKTMLVALSNDTKDNVEILKKHGVTYKQLNVEVYGLAKVMKTLQDAHLTGAESLKIFGSDAAAAGNILAANSTKIDEYAKKLENADGSAKKITDTLNQGLAKAFDALKGTLSEAALQLGDSGLKGALTDVIQQATGVIAIYEGMGDKFAESNNYTKEHYDNLKSVADELKIVAGAAGGIAALTGVIWAANAAMLAFNVATRANPLIMGATVVAAATGAAFAKIADNQSTIDKQIETAEKRIAAMEKYGVPNLIGTAIGFDTEKERTKLTALKQFKEEQLAATKATIDATAKTQEHAKSEKINVATLEEKSDKTKKLTEEQKKANKEQSEYQRLIESTPYGEYNATIDKLTEGLKRGGEAFRATYSTGIDEANKKLLDSTQYIKDHTTALKEQQQALERTARGKFEKGYSELMTQKPYMSDTEYSAGQDKLNADYLTQQQGVDFKTPAEQGKEALKAFNDEMDNTSKAFDKLGNSGSMAFDGILGGISAVAGAASSFATEIIKISDKQQASQEKYDAVIKSVGVTESEKADATKKFAADKIKLDAQAFSAEISGARQIAGATAKLFGEKSAARKAFHAIEMGMSVIEMAMAAKKMIVDVAAGAARMFAQGGFAGFAGVAAMAAIMGGLGFAMAGGGDKVTDLTTPETSTTGSVLGSDGASASIKNIVDTLNSIHASEYVELQGINSNFQNLTKLTTTSLALALRDRGSFNYSADQFKGSGVSAMAMVTGYLVAGVVGILGAVLLGVGKVKFEAVGGGIVSKAQKLMLDGMEKQIEVMDYTKIKKTVTGWFSNDVTYFDVITGANSQLTKLFQQVFSNVGTTLLQAATDSFKDTSLLNTDLTLPRIKLSLKSGEKNNAENQKKIEDAINKASDDIASQAFGRYLSAFQQMGEGLYETTIRLSAQAAVASGGMEKLGMKTNLTGLGLITFSDSLTRAFGGLKEFKAGIDSLYEAFTSDPQKLIDSKKQVADFLTKLKAPASAKLPAEITSTADAAKVRDYLFKTQTGIAGVAEKVGLASNVKPDSTTAKGLFNKLVDDPGVNKATKTMLKNTGFENITKDIISEAVKLSKFSISGEDGLAISKRYDPLIKYATENANFLASNQNLKTIRANKELEKSLTDLDKAMPTTTEEAAKLSEELTALSDKAALQVSTFEGLTKSTLNVIYSQEKLAEAGKYVTDFSKSISAWIKNVRATTGSPVNQLGMAKANFEEQLKLAKFGATAEEKRSALSGITGYADTYMNAIKSYYATSENGQKAIEDIMSQVSGLGQSVDVQELQLGALQDIKDAIDFGTIEVPKGISEANALLFQELINSTKAAGVTALKDPTTDNLLNYNALAKIVLLIDKSAQQGADATFLDALISSVAGESGLQAGIELIIDNVDFEAAKKEQIIANVLSSFNENRLTLTNFEFDVQAAIDAAKENVLASWGELKLNVTNDEAVNKIVEIDQLSKELNELITTKNGVTILNDDAKSKILEIDKLSKELNSLITKDNSLAVLNDDAKSKINDLILLASKLAENVKTEKALNVSANTAIDNMLEVRHLTANIEGGIIADKELNINTDTANQKLTDSILLSGEFTAAAELVPVIDIDTTIVIEKIAGITSAATTAIATLSAMAVENNNATASANAAIAANNAAAAAAATNNVAANAAKSKTDAELLGTKWTSADIDSGEITFNELTRLRALNSATSKTNGTKSLTSFDEFQLNEYSGQSSSWMNAYAKGGIANTPSIFGEAGAEAAVPLPDGRSIPVTLYNSANDSSVSSEETIAELKAQNNKLEVLVNTLMATSKAEREKTQELIDAMNGLRSDTRLAARG